MKFLRSSLYFPSERRVNTLSFFIARKCSRGLSFQLHYTGWFSIKFIDLHSIIAKTLPWYFFTGYLVCESFMMFKFVLLFLWFNIYMNILKYSSPTIFHWTHPKKAKKFESVKRRTAKKVTSHQFVKGLRKSWHWLATSILCTCGVLSHYHYFEGNFYWEQMPLSRSWWE